MTTCHEATEWLLEADLDELTSPADRAMSDHVAACRTCTARAARVLGDTAWLARAIPATTVAPGRTHTPVRGAPLRRGRTRTAFVATALLAASILVVLLVRLPRHDQHGVLSLRPTVVASGTTQPARSGVEQGLPAPSPGRNAMPAAHRPAAQAPSRRLASAEAVAPVALAPESVPAIATPALRLDTEHDRDSTHIEARPSLAVDVVPSTGRYAVLGSTPRVTVVWFY